MGCTASHYAYSDPAVLYTARAGEHPWIEREKVKGRKKRSRRARSVSNKLDHDETLSLGESIQKIKEEDWCMQSVDSKISVPKEGSVTAAESRSFDGAALSVNEQASISACILAPLLAGKQPEEIHESKSPEESNSVVAEADRLEAQRITEAERIAGLQRLEAIRKEEERVGAEAKAKAERLEAKFVAEAERLAELERLEAIQKEEERLAAEAKDEAERLEAARIAECIAELERLEVLRKEEERVEAIAKAEAGRLEAERVAEAERRAELERLEALRKEEERLAAEAKAEAEHLEAERIAEAERVAELERLTTLQREEECLAAEAKAEAERLEAERIAECIAELERLEVLRREEERVEAIAKAEAERLEAKRISEAEPHKDSNENKAVSFTRESHLSIDSLSFKETKAWVDFSSFDTESHCIDGQESQPSLSPHLKPIEDAGANILGFGNNAEERKEQKEEEPCHSDSISMQSDDKLLGELGDQFGIKARHTPIDYDSTFLGKFSALSDDQKKWVKVCKSVLAPTPKCCLLGIGSGEQAIKHIKEDNNKAANGKNVVLSIFEETTACVGSSPIDSGAYWIDEKELETSLIPPPKCIEDPGRSLVEFCNKAEEETGQKLLGPILSLTPTPIEDVQVKWCNGAEEEELSLRVGMSLQPKDWLSVECENSFDFIGGHPSFDDNPSLPLYPSHQFYAEHSSDGEMTGCIEDKIQRNSKEYSDGMSTIQGNEELHPCLHCGEFLLSHFLSLLPQSLHLARKRIDVCCDDV